MCINRLDDIVEKYNNTYRTVKMNPVDVKSKAYINFNKEVIIKVLNLYLTIMREYQNRKRFLQKLRSKLF